MVRQFPTRTPEQALAAHRARRESPAEPAPNQRETVDKIAARLGLPAGSSEDTIKAALDVAVTKADAAKATHAAEARAEAKYRNLFPAAATQDDVNPMTADEAAMYARMIGA